MIDRLKEEWARLRDDEPGERFQRRYDRRRESGESPLRRWGTIALGVVVLAAGIFFLPAPGPGMVVVALGAALIAQESAHMARALDWTELRIRRLLGWGRRIYGGASTGGRVLLIMLAVVVVAAALGGAYYLLFVR